MKFTDIFISKPVLAIVVSLFILLFGLARRSPSSTCASIRSCENAVINVSTIYFGADADLIQGFITTPLEREVASAEGIDYMVSTSSAGVSIQAYIRLDEDPNEALTQIAAKVNKLRNELPPEAEDPAIELQQGQQIAAMYMSFVQRAARQQPDHRLPDARGRAQARHRPRRAARARSSAVGTFAMRIWLEAGSHDGAQVTAGDVDAALQRQQRAVGGRLDQGPDGGDRHDRSTDLRDAGGVPRAGGPRGERRDRAAGRRRRRGAGLRKLRHLGDA